MTKMPRAVLALLLLAAIGGGAWALWPAAKAPAPTGPKGPAVPVSVAMVQRRDVPVWLDGIGSVQAYFSVNVRPQVDGQLKEVAFQEGQDVHAGEVLAQIDPRSFQAALNQALAKKAQDDAQLTNARNDLKRYAALIEKHYVTQQIYDTSKAQVNALEAAVLGDAAAVETARVNLGYTTIHSPIDGRAGIRQVDPGNVIHVNDPNGIVVVTQVHPISVLFTLPQDALPQVVLAMREGPLPVLAFSRDGRTLLDQGVLKLVDNVIDAATGTVKLKATMPNTTGLLWPGQFVNTRLLVGTRRQVPTLPATAVLRGQQGAYVYVVKADNTVEVRPVVPAQTVDGQTVIESGITDGETVVSAGQSRLQPGARVDAGKVN
jgi:membrane fusion protein, multidrug efflux system